MKQYPRLLILIIGYLPLLQCNPTGATVQEGSVLVHFQGSLLEIQAADRSIIHWEDFSIQAGETTRFIQPNPSSAVLNRVTGFNPSLINGLLEANGRVILINPHGVIIGKEGVIRVADFIGSTHNILNLDDWSLQPHVNSSIHIQGSSPSAAINHEGIIQASGICFQDGKILLVADNVQIQGSLNASQGTIEITALESVQISGSLDASQSGDTYGTVIVNAPNITIADSSELCNGIAASSIEEALNLNNHIRLSTLNETDTSHTITWNSDCPITWDNSSSLTFQAQDEINLTSNLQCCDKGAITIDSSKGQVHIGPPAPESTTFIDTDGAITVHAGNGFVLESGQADEDVRLRQMNPSDHPIDIHVRSGDAVLNALGGNSSCHIRAEGPLNIAADQGSVILNAHNPTDPGQITLYSHDHMKITAFQDIQGWADCANGVDPNILIHIDSLSAEPSSFEAIQGNILFHAGSHHGKWHLIQSNSSTTFDAGQDCSLISHSDLLCNMTLGKDTTFDIGRNMLIEANNSGSITVKENRSLVFDITGDMIYRSLGNANIEIIAGRTIDALIGGTFSLDKPHGTSSFPDIFFAAIGSNVIRVGKSLILGKLSSISSGNGPIMIKSNQNIEMRSTSSISLLSFIPGVRNPITLVIDEQAPTSPQIGTGQLIMEPGSCIGTDPQALAPVRIFTARRNQNTLQGQINSATFTPGAFNINTDTEQWGAHFTNTFFIPTESTFTIFYKEPQLGNALFALSQTIGKSFIALEPFTYPQSFYDDHFWSSQTNSTRMIAKEKKSKNSLLKQSIATGAIHEPPAEPLHALEPLEAR